jgi:hypothetical protein
VFRVAPQELKAILIGHVYALLIVTLSSLMGSFPPVSVTLMPIEQLLEIVDCVHRILSRLMGRVSVTIMLRDYLLESVEYAHRALLRLTENVKTARLILTLIGIQEHVLLVLIIHHILAKVHHNVQNVLQVSILKMAIVLNVVLVNIHLWVLWRLVVLV